MPKIIENLNGRLLEEVKLQLARGGYEAVTIRSIAKGCGVGVGTVYNYFPSKEALVAAYLLEDWTQCIEAVRSAAKSSDAPRPVLQCIYEQLTGFADRHQAVFAAKEAVSGFAASLNQYHALLRSQLAEPLSRFCTGDFLAQFIAESLLTWSMAGKSFEEIYEILKKVL